MGRIHYQEFLLKQAPTGHGTPFQCSFEEHTNTQHLDSEGSYCELSKTFHQTDRQKNEDLHFLSSLRSQKERNK